MANLARRDQRRKLQQDRRAQAAQKGSRMSMANGVQPPQMQTEERVFTPAEMKVFERKYKVYQEATDDLNDFLGFLREQHGIGETDGWQLGNRGFVRQVQAPTLVPPPAPPVKGKGKKGKAQEPVAGPLVPPGDAVDEPVEEVVIEEIVPAGA